MIPVSCQKWLSLLPFKGLRAKTVESQVVHELPERYMWVGGLHRRGYNVGFLTRPPHLCWKWNSTVADSGRISRSLDYRRHLPCILALGSRSRITKRNSKITRVGWTAFRSIPFTQASCQERPHLPSSARSYFSVVPLPIPQ